jgi:molybdenum cofactor sulfurtransferase
VSPHVDEDAATHILATDFSRFEDGTIDYLMIPAVKTGLDWITSIGIDVIHTRVYCCWLLAGCGEKSRS